MFKVFKEYPKALVDISFKFKLNQLIYDGLHARIYLALLFAPAIPTLTIYTCTM